VRTIKTLAAVQAGARAIELTELEVPAIGPGEALLRVQGNGICGTDYEQYDGALERAGIFRYPLIPGHEPVGVIEQIGAEASSLWGLAEGDRVAVESYVACHVCGPCRAGRTKHCVNRFMYGYMSLDVGCGLWGGFAEHMVLRPGTITHRLDPDLSVEDAALFNPLGGGFGWVRSAGSGPGDSLVILGPGQRGLGCVVAARESGVRQVIVTGLGRDRHKLDLAMTFGADAVIDAESEDVVGRVRELTHGGLADQVVDTTPYATAAIMQAVRCVRPGGTVVLGGVKGMREVADFVSDEVVLKAITIKGVVSADSWAYDRAIEVVSARRYPLHRMHTHSLPLKDVERGIELLGGSGPGGEEVLHITITP
jgi:threonine dehydrogenase-like Zn-dependent dehydrogenase